MNSAPAPRPGPGWLPLALAAWFASAILLLIGVGLFALLSGPEARSAASGPFIIAALLAPPLVSALRQIRGGPEQEPPPARAAWLEWLIPLAWILLLGASEWTSGTFIGEALFPVWSLAAFGLPVLWLSRLALRRLAPAPRWQSWSAFGIGLSATPLILIFLELAAVMLIAAIALAFDPTLFETVSRLAGQIRALSADRLIETLAPYLMSPGALFAIFSMISVIGPLLEEAIKPLGLWLFAGEIREPGQGFALGALSGAAYSLVEGVGNAGAAGADLALVAFGRVGTSLMHMLTSGLVGWALILAWRERRYLKLAAVYALAVLAHGVWNALGGLAAVGSLSTLTEGGPRLEYLTTVSAAGLFVMAGLLFAVFLQATRKNAPTPPEQQV